MTVGTATLLHGLMLEFGVLDGIIELWIILLMAIGAELAALLVELEARLGAVGIMTFIAILCHRGMDILHGKFLLPVLVALKTDLALGRRGDEQAFMFTGMGFMAGNTVTRAHRAVAMALGEDLGFMAVKTETADTGAITPQLKTHGRLMGVMAGDAALLHRGMDNAIIKLLYLGLVADHAEVPTGAGDGHGIIGTVGVMAGNADPGAHRTMDVGALAHLRMTAGGTGGAGRHDTLEIIVAPPQPMAFLTVELRGVGVDIKTFESLGGGLALFQGVRLQIIDMEALLLLAVGEGDGIISLIQAHHDPEGLVLHLDLIFGGLILDALDLQLADGGVTDNTGQKELFFRDPNLIGGGNHGDGVGGHGRGAVAGKQAGQQQDQGHHHNGPAAHLSSTLRNSFQGLSFQHISPHLSGSEPTAAISKDPPAL